MGRATLGMRLEGRANKNIPSKNTFDSKDKKTFEIALGSQPVF